MSAALKVDDNSYDMTGLSKENGEKWNFMGEIKVPERRLLLTLFHGREIQKNMFPPWNFLTLCISEEKRATFNN
jgi:hypothetical protein